MRIWVIAVADPQLRMAELDMQRMEIERALADLEKRQRETEAELRLPVAAPSVDVPRSAVTEDSGAAVMSSKTSHSPVQKQGVMAEEHRAEHQFFPGKLFSSSVETSSTKSLTSGSPMAAVNTGHLTEPFISGVGGITPGRAATNVGESSAWELTTADKRAAKTAAASVPQATEPAKTGRNVLLVYPRNMTPENVVRCVECARSTILQPSDVVTLVWAGRATTESSGDSIIFPPSMSDMDEDTKYSVRKWCGNAAHVLDSGVLATECARTPGLKAFPNADICWVLQQEFQDPELASIIVLLCSAGSADYEMEKFVIEHSPVPVALVRCPPTED